MDAPPEFLALLAAPFVGSFLGVLIVRLPEGRPVVFARSVCPACGARLGPAALVPLASWIALRGRCQACRAPIGVFYPAVELAALAVAGWAYVVTSGWLFWASLGLGWALLALAAVDWRSLILPDWLTLPLVPAGLAVIWLVEPQRLVPHAIGGIAGFVGFAAIAAAYRALRGREGLGLGDAKLLAAAGAWCGWAALPSVVLIGGFSALALALAARLAGRPLDGAVRIAFGPHLALAVWIVWLHGPLVPFA